MDLRNIMMEYTCRNIYISLLMNEKVYSVDLPTLRNVPIGIVTFLRGGSLTIWSSEIMFRYYTCPWYVYF